MQTKAATQGARYKNYRTFRGYINAVANFFPLMTNMRTTSHNGESPGVVKQLAVALFVPVVTGVFTAIVAGYVTSAVLTERLTILQSQIARDNDRMNRLMDRMADQINRNDEKTTAWILQHERETGGRR